MAAPPISRYGKPLTLPFVLPVQSRPAIFDLEIRSPENLYERVVEVDEQVGWQSAM